MKVYVNYLHNSKTFSGGQATKKAKAFCIKLSNKGISSEIYWKGMLLWEFHPINK